MDHPRSKLPAVLAVLFCIALLGGVGVLLWKTLPEKQQPQQAETIQTDSVFSSEQTAVEPEREAPYEGELPEQAEKPTTQSTTASASARTCTNVFFIESSSLSSGFIGAVRRVRRRAAGFVP